MRQDAKSVENRTIVQHHKSNQEEGEEYGRKERERDRARYRDKETRDLVVRFEPTISVCVGILLFRGVGFEIHDRSLSIDWYHACFCFFRPRFSLIPLLLHVFFLCQKDYFFLRLLKKSLWSLLFLSLFILRE